MKIIVCDPVSPKGVALLKARPEFEVVELGKRHSEDELIPIVSDAVGILVRSETKITKRLIESASKLKVVGRAGVGVDNIDVEAATNRGVVVMNAPGGNTIATAELTMALMLALARNIPQAHASVKAGEWNRKAFHGIELYGKTLGILGLGRIGGEVAKRAMAFGMTVIAYDPYVTLSRANALQVELVELDELFARADFITVHMPLTNDTKNMINAASIAKMKKGVRIINCARGGIVNEADLAEAIKSGHVAGAALDVYESEPPPADFPLRDLPRVIMTPHLGASTEEAQENVGVEVAQAIIDYLLYGVVRNAVNVPSLDLKTYSLIRPYLLLGEKLGKLVAQIAPKRNERLVITYGGKAVEVPGEPIVRAVLKGFLESAGGHEVNMVNARALAKALGLVVEEIKSSEELDYTDWLQVMAQSGETKVSCMGTFFGPRQQPRVVRISDKPVEIVPEGVLLLLTNRDRPGIVGIIGTIMAKYNINIASMRLTRDVVGGRALTVMNLDSVPSLEAIEEIKSHPDISDVKVAVV
jgi:D-3-phosphoglycerate dehydrogenase